MALTIWDQALGVSREATQEDIDIMQAKVSHLSAMLFDWAKGQERMYAEISSIHQRYQQSAELTGGL